MLVLLDYINRFCQYTIIRSVRRALPVIVS